MCFQHQALAALLLVRSGLAHARKFGSQEHEQVVLSMYRGCADLGIKFKLRWDHFAEVVSRAGSFTVTFSYVGLTQYSSG